MRMILLTISLIVVAAPSYAAQRQSLEQNCRVLVGKEEPERAPTEKATWGNSTCSASPIACWGTNSPRPVDTYEQTLHQGNAGLTPRSSRQKLRCLCFLSSAPSCNTQD